jgi:hypothetical protein
MDVPWLIATRGKAADVDRREIGRRPVIVANPRGDAAFRVRIGMAMLHGVAVAADLQTALRLRYPKAVVRPRELENEPFEVWYVYREGHWIRSEPDAET